MLNRDNITRVENETIVGQRCTLGSRSGTNDRNIKQALITRKPTRRNRNQVGANGGGGGSLVVP